MFRGLVGMLLLAGCRLDNPAYRSASETTALQEASTQGVAGSQDPEPDHRPPNRDEPLETGPGSPTGHRDPHQSSGLTEAPSSTSSHSSETGSGAPGICASGPWLCYPLTYDSSARQSQASQAGQPSLKLMNHNKPIVPGGSSNEPAEFQNNVTFNGQGHLKIEDPVPVGTSLGYGFDLTIRDFRCQGGSSCIVAGGGDILIELNDTAKEIACAVVEMNQYRARATRTIDLSQTLNIGCFTQGNSIAMFVNGVRSTQPRPQAAVTFQQVFVSLGVPDSTNSGGALFGTVGRFRYWRDHATMNAALGQ